MSIDKYKEYAPVVLRIGLAVLMLWFGLTNIFNPGQLAGYLPSWFTFIAPLTFMFYNGIFEVILGIALLLGYFTRVAAFLAFIHITGIGFSLGYNDIAVRDYALAISALAVFLHGRDKLCNGKKW